MSLDSILSTKAWFYFSDVSSLIISPAFVLNTEVEADLGFIMLLINAIDCYHRSKQGMHCQHY